MTFTPIKSDFFTHIENQIRIRTKSDQSLPTEVVT